MEISNCPRRSTSERGPAKRSSLVYLSTAAAVSAQNRLLRGNPTTFAAGTSDDNQFSELCPIIAWFENTWIEKQEARSVSRRKRKSRGFRRG